MIAAFTEYAFDNPVQLTSGMLIRTASQAAELVSSSMRTLFTIHGLNTVLILERAVAGDEVEEARVAFWTWARQQRLA